MISRILSHLGSSSLGAIGAMLATATLGLGATTAGHKTVETIYVRNTSHLDDSAVKNAMPAFQAAVDKDFGPLWHIRVRLQFINSQVAPRGQQVIRIQDKLDIPNALGYHTLQSGVPYAKIGYGVDIAYGYSWTVTFTHELFEMLVDPSVNRTEQNQLSNVSGEGTQQGSIWAAEVGDPVEAEKYGYTRPGADGKPVLISDFVTDRWFGATTTGPFDFMNHVTAPLQVLSGGYAQYWDGVMWHQVFGRGGKSRTASLYSSGDRSPSAYWGS